MINVILSGCNGKMGGVVSETIKHSDGINIVCGVDINPTSKSDYPVFSLPEEFKGEADVIIDFSHPSTLTGLLDYSLRRKMPIVVATTGLAADQISQIKTASKSVPVFFSANMSLGVNLLVDLVMRAAKFLEDSFDIEIIEKHHNQKIDAPSGTALAIADAITEAVSKPCEYVYDRHSVRKKRKRSEIGIHAIRGGTIVGEHSVIFAGMDEIIEIKHQAASKEIFAVGAVRAARFIIGKPPALYDMRDIVNSERS
ncbi:MAG: 4-hydroxy-tetrahydrodipicolinate reductase [Firmicutes bacterium]|nr:4-hydroxy-tetrahydrodipicolinate reductase [Bacillota bacterium]